MARRKLVAGNWKMNGRSFDMDELKPIDEIAYTAPIDVAICPPATLINHAHSCAPHLFIGGQDCHGFETGAFTGWLSAQMLRDAGASMVIVGHSERRQFAGETDRQVSEKADAALAAGLLPIVCVGESAAERDSGKHVERVLSQLDGSLPADTDDRTVIAYEPIWAIGTGKTATPEDVAEMHGAIRNRLRQTHPTAADSMRILYGGSVNAGNAASLFALDDVDGALVGGASLKAGSFIPIIEAATGAVDRA